MSATSGVTPFTAFVPLQYNRLRVCFCVLWLVFCDEILQERAEGCIQVDLQKKIHNVFFYFVSGFLVINFH